MKTETRGIIKSSPWTAEKQGCSCAAAHSAAEEAEDALEIRALASSVCGNHANPVFQHLKENNCAN